MRKTRVFGLGCGGLLLFAGLLYWIVYWGYCWGWWGQSNRFLQYAFQCQCPIEGEEARYPESIDVLFSACEDPGSVRLSPSGRYWQITLHDKRYSYDYATDQLRPYSLPGPGFFLTDEYIMTFEPNSSSHFKDHKHYLYSVGGEKLLQFNLAQINDDLSLDATTIRAFRDADKVYIFEGRAVALAKDPLQNLAANYVLGDPDDGSLTAKQIEQILEQYGINYQVTTPGRISHNGLMQSDDVRGIMLIANGKTLASNYNPYNDLNCDLTAGLWVYEDRGAIMSQRRMYLTGCSTGRPIEVNAFEIPQPLLLLKVPPEYLSPQAREADKAKQAEENANKQQAVTTFWVINIVVMALVSGLSVLIFWRQRKPSKNQMVADS
jgi:hypothetical protein